MHRSSLRKEGRKGKEKIEYDAENQVEDCEDEDGEGKLWKKLIRTRKEMAKYIGMVEKMGRELEEWKKRKERLRMEGEEMKKRIKELEKSHGRRKKRTAAKREERSRQDRES